MAVVLDNEPGERVLLYGADGSTLRKVVVDASGRLVIVGPGAGGSIPVTLTNYAAETGGNLAAILAKLDVALSTRDLEAGSNLATLAGRDAIYNYLGIIGERINKSAAAGQNFLTGTAVPANRVHVVTVANALNFSTTNTDIAIGLAHGSVSPNLVAQSPPLKAFGPSAIGTFVLGAGDQIYAQFDGCLLNDDLYLQYLGYRMK